ncbi:hypothetical protein NHF40_13770 [Maricaulaceae bacterium EIL42A08]|nr:hypothetical protein [Maricaulaceae bacterium EIL42A08]
MAKTSTHPKRIRRSLGEMSFCAALEAGEKWTPVFHKKWCKANRKNPNDPITVRAELIRAILFVEGAHMSGCTPPTAEAERLDAYSLDPKRRHLAQALVIDWVTDNLATVDRTDVEKDMEAMGEFEPLPDFWTKEQKDEERERRITAECDWRAHHLIANRPVVTGDLNFTGGRFPGAMLLRGCVFGGSGARKPGAETPPAPVGNLTLDRAMLGGLDLAGAALGQLSGDRLRVEADFQAWDLDSHEAALRGVRIGGGLFWQGARLRATFGCAMNANAAEIGADVFLCDGFRAAAEVSIKRSQIRGQLVCTGGRFGAKTGNALNADAAEIGADVFLRNGFFASAEVNLRGSQIRGQLDYTGGRFEAETGRALDADCAEIGADVFLRNGFFASAKVDFVRARIAGSLILSGGHLKPSNGGVALDLDSAEIGASLMFAIPWSGDSAPARIAGDVDLSNARCAVLDDAPLQPAEGQPWLEKDAKLILDGFTYGRLGSRSPTDWANRKAWLGCQPEADREGDAFKPQPYEQLIKVLREMGHPAEAREVGRAKEGAHHSAVWHRTLEGGWIQKALARAWWVTRWLLFKLTGYGYRPARPFACIGLPLLLVSLFIFASAYRQGFVTPAQPHAALAQIGADVDAIRGAAGGAGPPCPAADLTEAVPPFHAGMYVIDAFVPLVDIDQESSWKPARTARCGGDAATLARLDALNPGWAFTVGEQTGPFSVVTNAIDAGVRWWAPRGGLLWLQWLLMISGFAISALIAASLSGLIRRD